MILVVVLTDAAAASCAGGGRELVLTEPPAEAAVTGETAGDEEPAEEEPSSEESGETAASAERPATIWVHVCGAVKREGVYELPEGSRVFEALRLAGGCTAEADTSYCNQAAVLSDAQKVYIPTKEEAEKFFQSLTDKKINLDELEKSIVGSLADEVTVGIQGRRIRLVISKR